MQFIKSVSFHINPVCESPQRSQLYDIPVEQLNWTEAREHCRAWGGYLMDVGSVQERKFIEEVLHETNNLNS